MQTIMKLTLFFVVVGGQVFSLPSEVEHSCDEDGLDCADPISDRTLLQKISNRHQAEGNRAISPLDIKQWDCSKTSSFQATTPEGATYSKITKWNRKDGSWTDLVKIPFSSTDPPFRSINSCAVNPKDKKLYCSMEINNKGSFLMRIDDEKVGYVKKLLPWMWAAAFDEDDNYYAYGGENNQELGEMTVIKGVSKMDAWDSWSAGAIQAEQALGGVSVKVDGKKTIRFRLGADFALVNYDVQGTGSNQVYLASMLGDEMKLLLVSSEYELFTLSCPKCDLPKEAPSNYPKKRVWGTAWSFKDTKNMYFAPDGGEGLHVAHPKNIDWSAKTVFVNFAGAAVQTDWNDGISCGHDPISLQEIGCEKPMYRSTTHKFNKADAVSEIQVLDPDTGKNTGEGFEVKDHGLKGLNACSINPKDNKIYCILHYDNGDWVARVDQEGSIGFVKKVYNYAYAATFDAKGTYWFLNNNEGLMKLDNLNLYTAFDLTNKANKNISQQGGEKQKFDPGAQSFAKKLGADLAIFKKDKKTYLMSILRSCRQDYQPYQTFKNRISLVDITDGNAKEPIVLYDTGKLPEPLPVDKTPDFMKPSDVNCQTWGSSWNMKKNGKEGIFFAPDSGQGIYELDSIDLDSSPPAATFTSTGMSVQQTGWNNGFSCRNDKDPEDIGKVSS